MSWSLSLRVCNRYIETHPYLVYSDQHHASRLCVCVSLSICALAFIPSHHLQQSTTFATDFNKTIGNKGLTMHDKGWILLMFLWFMGMIRPERSKKGEAVLVTTSILCWKKLDGKNFPLLKLKMDFLCHKTFPFSVSFLFAVGAWEHHVVVTFWSNVECHHGWLRGPPWYST